MPSYLINGFFALQFITLSFCEATINTPESPPPAYLSLADVTLLTYEQSIENDPLPQVSFSTESFNDDESDEISPTSPYLYLAGNIWGTWSNACFSLQMKTLMDQSFAKESPPWENAQSLEYLFMANAYGYFVLTCFTSMEEMCSKYQNRGSKALFMQRSAAFFIGTPLLMGVAIMLPSLGFSTPDLIALETAAAFSSFGILFTAFDYRREQRKETWGEYFSCFGL